MPEIVLTLTNTRYEALRLAGVADGAYIDPSEYAAEIIRRVTDSTEREVIREQDALEQARLAEVERLRVADALRLKEAVESAPPEKPVGEVLAELHQEVK